MLRSLCGTDELHFELTRELLAIEKRHKSMLRRAGIFVAMEQAFHRSFYADEDDAVTRARQRRDAVAGAREHAESAPVVVSMVQQALDLGTPAKGDAA